jgi:hypothetical protein
MKDPCDDIRDWIYTTLSGHISYGGALVPVYSFPPENVSYPYIMIGEQSAQGEDGAKDRWLFDVTTMLHIFTQHKEHDASYVPVNTISSSVMERIRRRNRGDSYATGEETVTLANFELVKVNIGPFTTERYLTETGVILGKQISINTLVEED